MFQLIISFISFSAIFLTLLSRAAAFGNNLGVRNTRRILCNPLKATVSLETGKFDEEVIHSKGPVIVDFYANWCGPCKLMAPIFEQLSDEMPNVKFVKVDTDIHEETVERFEIQGLPLFGLFLNGEMIASHSGALKKDLLKTFVEKGVTRS